MRCKKYVMRHDKKRDRDYLGNCANKARHFFQIRLSSKARYAESLPDHGIFGFCNSCAEGMEDPSNWKTEWGKVGKVLGLYGAVSTVEPTSESEAVDDKKEKFRSAVKSKFKVAFGLKWTAKVTNEEWEVLFREALDEFTIEGVMKT